MADPIFGNHEPGLSSPAEHGAAVTPSDTTTLTTTRALFVGTGATELTVVLKGGETVTFTNVPDGTLLPIRATKVLDTGTDATDIVALW